jgi:DNA mismatch repair protein MutL
MADIIRLLPDSVANQIAAGEVIQRPASVVKELMENAIDSGSTSISILIKDGGKTSIQVIDNGCGMSETDARLAFERHATSKIKEAGDLFEIRTMGFRGEALASIAAIAGVTLKTRKSKDELGTAIQINGSVVENQEPVQCPAGSNFIVSNLFFNVPARRKFLKNTNTEFRHIVEEFMRIALSHPDVEFGLKHNDSEIYKLPSATHKQRIIHIFGRSINANLIPFEADTIIVKIKGFIGRPEFAKKKFGEQFFFINNRYMRHPYFHRAVMNAYDQILPTDYVPTYFIFFESDPRSIDVNIHPTKTEIKFEDEQAVFQIVKAAVREAIGKSNIAPSINFDNEQSIEIPSFRKDADVRPPEIPVNPEFNPFDDGIQNNRESKAGKNLYKKTNMPEWERFYEGFESEGDHPDSFKILNKQEPQFFPSDKNLLPVAFLQVKNRYIITTVKSGVMIIDQKRAHERILYEKLIHSLANNFSIAQQSLFPETIELDPRDYSLLNEIFDDVTTIGFDISNFGKGTIVVNGCPAEINNPEPKALIESILEEYRNTESDIKKSSKEKVARCLAKSSSIGYVIALTIPEMQVLIDQLFACENPNYSPSGKKIISILSLEEMEKKLG